MMNIGNLGSKESIGVKYKDGTYALLCLKLWFESDWYFCNITESGWFLKSTAQKQSSRSQFLKSV